MHPDFETYYEATVIKTTPTHTGIQIDRHKNRFNIFVRHFWHLCHVSVDTYWLPLARQIEIFLALFRLSNTCSLLQNHWIVSWTLNIMSWDSVFCLNPVRMLLFLFKKAVDLVEFRLQVLSRFLWVVIWYQFHLQSLHRVIKLRPPDVPSSGQSGTRVVSVLV